MATAKLLALTSFAVNESNIIFTMKGTAKGLPESVESKAGVKGHRVVTLATDAHGPLYDLGKAIKVNGVTDVADEDADFFGWYTLNFVPKDNGGGLVPTAEGAEAKGEAGDSDAAAEEPAEVPRDVELLAQTAAQVKVIAKELGIKATGTKKVIVQRILDHEALAAHDAEAAGEPEAEEAPPAELTPAQKLIEGKVAEAKARIVTCDDEALLNAAKAAAKRSSVVKAIDKRIGQLNAPVKEVKPPKVDPEEEKRRNEASAILHALAPQIGELVGLLNAKRAKTALTRLVGLVQADGSIDVPDDILRGGSEGKGKIPMFFVDGAIHTVTKTHRDERGQCTYSVKCLEGGGYELVAVKGKRDDLKVGQLFKHGLELVQVLTGRERGIPTVWRWFNLA